MTDPDCPDCHGTGELYVHSTDCRNDHCALAAGHGDCKGEVVPCDCTLRKPPRKLPPGVQNSDPDAPGYFHFGAPAWEPGDHFEINHDGPVVCGDCDGSGACPDCNGKADGVSMLCSYCDNDGSCPSCNGSGVEEDE
jgi:hypothetical protein